MPFDPMYLLLVMLPGLLISGGASLLVKSAFSRYSRVGTRQGYTGAQAAQILLDRAGIHDVRVVQTQGYLSDHYNPTSKQLALSPDVYHSNSIAAVGVACHEAGHAIQHARHYAPLWARSALVPMAGIGSNLGYFVMLFGLFIHPYVVLAGVALFGMVLLFQIVTLPVEFDATARAKRLVLEAGIVSPDERTGMDRVLNAAALTYVAAVVSTLLTILYFLIRSGILGGRRD
ncbi:MAG: zinc metallopeptidase [Pirellulaceae bacterium]|nr:zinc metallopeptidase [Planctomycetales bacterium]MCA9203886.1 zinc metallopeptidase [Planctomycetales bacterium]MCA9221720.1 zinc metallopeptidase [Planctomycetales bacterium]MCA9226936.1 zinc metallopeptidase [Planctomycetales bacterium]